MHLFLIFVALSCAFLSGGILMRGLCIWADGAERRLARVHYLAAALAIVLAATAATRI